MKPKPRYGVYLRTERGALTLAFTTERYISRAECLAQGYAKCVLMPMGRYEDHLPSGYLNPQSDGQRSVKKLAV